MRSSFGAFPLLAVLSASLCAPAGAQLPQTPWSELGPKLAGRLLPAEKLGVAECPADVAARRPSRRVLQVIENVFYSWEEFDLDPEPGKSYCLVMKKPLALILSPEEAQVLLTASSLWESAMPLPAAAASGAGPVAALEAAMPLERRIAEQGAEGGAGPDRGLAGWAGPELKGLGREGDAPRRKSEGKLGSITGGSVIGGADGRTRVADTTAFPYRTIALLQLTQSSPRTHLDERFQATGSLVSPYMVLTNGHVVWDGEEQRLSRDFDILPAYAPGSAQPAPFGQKRAVRLATNSGWVETSQIQYDYGAAFVDAPFSGQATFMPLVFDVAPGAGGTVNVAGYPLALQGQTNNQAMWVDTDQVYGVQGRVLRHKVDTSGGNSGSPVWETFSASALRRVIAVHSSGDDLGIANSAARLVAANFDLISEWVQWTPLTRRALNLTLNQIDGSQCPAIQAIVNVADAAGDPITDLTRANFHLLENGFPQPINVSQALIRDVPVAVTLVLDASGSLSESDVANIRSSSRNFVDLLGTRDKVAVYHFANGVARAQDFTNDKTAAKVAINLLTRTGGVVGDGGSTALYDAIVEAAGYSRQAVGRQALVVMTDGNNNTGSASIQTAIDAARAAAIPAFTIGFGSADESVLRQIAQGTGGLFFFGGTSADLQAILQAIGRSLDNQYILSWPTKFATGGTNSVEVTVTDGADSDNATQSYSQAGTSCRTSPSCTRQITSPNGGEVWLKGTRQTIRWQSSGPACGAVGIGVYAGNQVFPLVDLTADDGQEIFNIDFLPPGELNYVVLLDRTNNAESSADISDSAFSIRAPAASLPCATGPFALCLAGGRYSVRVLWKNASVGGGSAKAVQISPDSGYFWFFDAGSPEIFAKVIDGRTLNGSTWVFSGALSDFQYAVLVTDTRNGETRVYNSQKGEFASFADTSAFGPRPELPETTKRAGLAAPSRDEQAGEELRMEPEVEVEAAEDAKAAVVLWNQLEASQANGISSEHRLDANASAFDTEGADDFVVPANTTWRIEGADVSGVYYGIGARGPAQSVNVRIYANQNGVPGAPVCTYLSKRPRAGLASGSFEIDLPAPCTLGAGRYWLSVQTDQDYVRAGQWGWRERTARRELASLWRNPGGGYVGANGACRSFRPRIGTCRVGTGADFHFRLRGEKVTRRPASCKSSSTALCFAGKRFQVELGYIDNNGRRSNAKVSSTTASTGYFWFSAAARPELAVKVVDGRTFNGSYWIFQGGLSDFEYTLKVTDTVTGRVKTYPKKRGEVVSLADTVSFPDF